MNRTTHLGHNSDRRFTTGNVLHSFANGIPLATNGFGLGGHGEFNDTSAGHRHSCCPEARVQRHAERLRSSLLPSLGIVACQGKDSYHFERTPWSTTIWLTGPPHLIPAEPGGDLS